MSCTEKSNFLAPTPADCKAAMEKAIWRGSRGIRVIPFDECQPCLWALGKIAQESLGVDLRHGLISWGKPTRILEGCV